MEDWTCVDCGREFCRESGQDWVIRCRPCYRLHRATLRVSAPAGGRPSGVIPPDMLARLLQLCRPDRHGFSPTSLITTQWLLEQGAVPTDEIASILGLHPKSLRPRVRA